MVTQKMTLAFRRWLYPKYYFEPFLTSLMTKQIITNFKTRYNENRKSIFSSWGDFLWNHNISKQYFEAFFSENHPGIVFAYSFICKKLSYSRKKSESSDFWKKLSIRYFWHILSQFKSILKMLTISIARVRIPLILS